MKVGDKVLMENGYGYRTVTISKVTPTGIYKIKNSTISFDKYGRERGSDSFGAYRIREITDEDRDMFRRNFILKLIKDKDFKELNIEELEKIFEILEKK